MKDGFDEDGYVILNERPWLQTHLSDMKTDIADVAAAYGLDDPFSEAGIAVPEGDARTAFYRSLRYLPSLSRLAASPRILEIVKGIGLETPLLMNASSFRMDEGGENPHKFAWHQDYSYLLGSVNSVTFWIPFQDVSDDLGGVEMVSGSHRAGQDKGRTSKPQGHRAGPSTRRTRTDCQHGPWRDAGVFAVPAAPLPRTPGPSHALDRSIRYSGASDPDFASFGAPLGDNTTILLRDDLRTALRQQGWLMNDIEQTGLQVSRNAQQNVDYYKGLTEFFEQDPTATLAKLFSFPVYVPRQVIEDFLARYELYRMVQHLHGSIYEFGTFNGAGCFSFATFSTIMEPQNLTRKIVTFDTYTGFPSISEADKSGNKELVHEGGLTGRPLERLEQARDLWDSNRFLGHVSKLEFVKGDIIETLEPYLEQNPHALPALLYLDFDLFEPTAHVLRHMLPRMQKSSIVAFDELNHSSFPGETVTLLQELDIAEISIKRIPFSSRISYFVVGD